MDTGQFSLVLGCGGYEYYNLTICAGTYNVIINFDRHFEQLELDKIMDFLDFTCGLFDSTIGDWNKITNTLKMLREQYKLIDDKMWEALHVWLLQHKRCGAFLRLMLNTDIDSTFKPEEAHIEPNHLERTITPIPAIEIVLPPAMPPTAPRAVHKKHKKPRKSLHMAKARKKTRKTRKTT